jgi:hypothetical protein
MRVQNRGKLILLDQIGLFIFGIIFLFHNTLYRLFIDLFLFFNFFDFLFLHGRFMVHHSPQEIIIQLVKAVTMQGIENLALLGIPRLGQIVNILLELGRTLVLGLEVGH